MNANHKKNNARDTNYSTNILQIDDVTYSTSVYCAEPKTTLKQFVDQYVEVE